MEYKPETKICQNCKKDFTIEPDDFSFYEKIKVPPPTFCPECRFVRRLVWKNEKSLYKVKCYLCNKDTFSMFNPQYGKVTYCMKCWWSDKWDPNIYQQNYDFSISFFKQYYDLLNKIPKLCLEQKGIIVNSSYSNFLVEAKNVYLSTSISKSENIYYSTSIDKSTNILDSFFCDSNDSCLENIDCYKNYNCFYSQNSRECLDCFFIFDCSNCNNCFMSSNLRNGEYYFYNKKLNKEEYFLKIKEVMLSSFSKIKKLKSDFENLKKKSIHKFANINKSIDCVGNNILSSKNCRYSFNLNNSENIKYSVRGYNLKDSYDLWGGLGELLMEGLASGFGNYNVFSYNVMNSITNSSYISYCYNSSNLFACIGLRSKQYCILNKQYTKEEYEELVPKIIQHMNDMPYIDSKGRIYKYGEFFPSELSPFCYNETIAQEYYPLTKEQALSQGYRWKDKEERNYNIDIYNKDIPDDINDTNEDIINKVIECNHKDCNHQCTEAFKIIPEEYQFYKRMNLPLPRLCPNCRHYERLSQRNPLKLWHRSCMKPGCTNTFETSYSPDRPEIIYCEKCYQQEVY